MPSIHHRMVTICPNSVARYSIRLLPWFRSPVGWKFLLLHIRISGNRRKQFKIGQFVDQDLGIRFLPLGLGDAGNLWTFGVEQRVRLRRRRTHQEGVRDKVVYRDSSVAPSLDLLSGEANLSATRVFLDGERIDLASSIDGVVNTTTSIIPLKVGASSSGGSKMTGWLDEVRVSTADRDHAWAKYSYQNQKPGKHPCLRKTSIIFCRRFCLRI